MKATPEKTDCPDCGSEETVGVEGTDLVPADEPFLWLCRKCGHAWPRFFEDEYITVISSRLADKHNQLWSFAH